MSDPTPQRLDRLEESQTFAEHRVDQLAAQMEAMHRALTSVERRLATLEQRLDAALNPPQTPSPDPDE
jgi:uncharacterized coiled-coil protein SlyX